LALTVDNRTENYVIIGIESFDINAEIPLKVSLDIGRNITFSVDEKSGFGDQEIYLIDYQEGEYYPIHNNSIELTVDAGTYADRFVIGFKIPAALSLGNGLLLDTIAVFHDSDNRNIVVKSENTSLEKIEIINLLGKRISVYSNLENSNRIELSSNGLSSAIYLIRIKTNEGFFHKKIVID
jgi:hypothetical protein